MFDIYRVIAADGTAKRGNLVEAIADASKNGVAVFNVSVGVYHHEEPDGDCGGHCRVADETRLAIEGGTNVIAATGHRGPKDPRAVHCPALLEGAIAVGGFVARCRHDLEDDRDSGQYWVREGDRVDGPYCGQRGCRPGQRCTDNRYESPWQGNVSFHNAVPDVLAPVHHPAGDDSDPVLQSGTSFGTPVVSGMLAAILGDLEAIPDPETIREAVVVGSSEIDRGDLVKLDGEHVQEILE